MRRYVFRGWSYICRAGKETMNRTLNSVSNTPNCTRKPDVLTKIDRLGRESSVSTADFWGLHREADHLHREADDLHREADDLHLEADHLQCH
jgi:hypothetical protein